MTRFVFLFYVIYRVSLDFLLEPFGSRFVDVLGFELC